MTPRRREKKAEAAGRSRAAMGGMGEKDKVPEKIDMAEILGGDEDPADIEVLDPATGGPLPEGAQATRPSARAATDPALVEELRAAIAEKDKYHDLWIRTRADFENFRKRIERERLEERSQAGAALVKDLLPVLDNLERALAGCSERDPFRDGVALIHKQLKDSLTAAGLEAIEALGERFNPVYHDAVATVGTTEFEPNTVLEEVQKGYRFRGRVLRPALVRVAVGAPGMAASPEDALDRDGGEG